jgi:acyl-homoserine-lactone acylase
VNTPRGLNTANPLVGRALADAITDLKGAGIPIDAGLRGQQYSIRGGKKIWIHGGPHALGNFNVMTAPWDPKTGYGDIEHGSSFIMAAQFTGGKCPVRAGTFVTYSESENQSSRHASDFTRAFSKKRWNPAPFCSRDVRRATLSKKKLSIRMKGRRKGR